MLVGAKACDLTEDLLRLVCGLYVGILMPSPTMSAQSEWFQVTVEYRLYSSSCKLIHGPQAPQWYMG